MTDHRGDWERLIDEASAVSSMAVELSAISAHELPGLLEYLGVAPRLPFSSSACMRLPRGSRSDEQALVNEIRRIPTWVDVIVLQPHTISDPTLYRPLGRRLALENMDTRKVTGHEVDHLDPYFAVLSDARLCFDVAHAKDVDPTLGVAEELLRRYSQKGNSPATYR